MLILQDVHHLIQVKCFKFDLLGVCLDIALLSHFRCMLARFETSLALLSIFFLNHL